MTLWYDVILPLKKQKTVVDSESVYAKWTTTGEGSAISTDGDRCSANQLGGAVCREGQMDVPLIAG